MNRASASAAAMLAVVTPHQEVDRLALARRSRTVQEQLEAVLRPGAPLGIWIEDGVDFAAGVTAAAAARAAAFLVPPDAPSTRLAELCAIEGATSVLCDEEHAPMVVGGTHRSSASGLVLVQTASAGSTSEVAATSDRLEGGSVHFFTSGTDGNPKGVARTNASLELEASTVGAHLGMTPGGVVLCAVPITHGYGFTAGLFAPLAFGGTAVVAQPRLPASLAKTLTRHRPDIVVAVPAQYAAWAESKQSYRGPVPRLWLCGGAPLPGAVRAKFQAAWGGVIAEQYGMTETGAVCVDLDGAETLGRPYPGVTVSIAPGYGSEPFGEVLVTTPYGPRGYLGVPADRPGSPFTRDGVRTGDTGWLDDQGRLHLVGRRAHQLNVHGRKVDPVEVERAFWALDGVQDVAVLGVDRAAGDQWIAAFVVCAAGVTEDALREASSGLERFKRPQRVVRLAELPKNASGKTDFATLRARLRHERS